MKIRRVVLAALVVGVILLGLPALGRPGAVLAQDSKSPSTTDGGSQLPKPAPPFRGKIGQTFKDSKQDFPQPVKAPQGAPNVIVILLDDVGFGQPSTFGGPIPTPQFDKLARQGLRYTRFHTIGICSPTRIALLTGRNHHQVATGTITELSTGFPGYNGVWPREAASVARVLQENGYSTGVWGKWHNTPDWDTSPIGPFNRWPSGLGFQYFYGFQGGETSQWEPQLFRNELPVEPGKKPEQGYHLTEDLVDDAIAWLSRQQSIAPDKPYFMYFSTGAAHSPLHVPEEWIAKFKGKFDQGWDAVREETINRQKNLGVVPQDTLLTPRPKQIPGWETLSADQKRLYARHMEVFAAFLAHTDHHVGRLIDAVRGLPDGDNTMIVFIAGDNGPSAEGTLTGTRNSMMSMNGVGDTVEEQLPLIDKLGGPETDNHYPVGWAWAGSSPFQWTKRVPSHFGGTRNGTVISWPKRIKDVGTVRTQFHHVIDVVPTIYQAAGVPAPSHVDGVPQMPIAGVDMSYTFDDAQAKGQRTTQYFETGGHRAIYHNGWVAASFHGVPWELTGSIGFENNVWELYNVDKDFSQAVDLATKNPQKLEELKKVFAAEAEKFGVYPLDDRFVERGINPERPSVIKGRTNFSYAAGTTRIPEGSAPPIYQRSHKITAKVTIPKDGCDGVITATGGTTGGYTLFVKDGKLHYHYNFFGKKVFKVASDDKLPSGDVEIALEYEQKPFRQFVETTGGTAKLSVKGQDGLAIRPTENHTQDGLAIRPANRTYFEKGVDMRKKLLLTVMIVVAPLGLHIAVPPSAAQAQQANATAAAQPAPVLPRPEAPFGGRISRKASESTPDFPKEVTAPKGAPNVLVILTDDVGFSATSPFGGPIPTETFDRLAKNGLRYTQFHTTALCSPTRAALLSGRNHHTNASGVIMELGTGFPGYNTIMPKSCGTFAEVLHGLVRQEPQCAGLALQSGRTIRSLADRSGVRVLLRLHRWGHEPVGAGALREHEADRAAP